ncbi:hypothetical protein SAMN04487771_1001106 [[Clostridium] aminophilum]|uniref:Uncharacterized protein n=1 Tax=[Clostridium] aminophilum TaxID=1526 RepID=A0A1I0A6R1_9FIRM|nr:hypothetical protein SAMN04487771_1001106 [[Clostridium] aminophilum]
MNRRKRDFVDNGVSYVHEGICQLKKIEKYNLLHFHPACDSVL